MDALQRWLERQSNVAAHLWALAGIAAVGYLQYLSGPRLVFSIFYVLPLMLLGWKVGGRAAAPLCAAAAIVAALGDFSFEPDGRDLWIVFWNASSRFGVFLIVASLRAGIERQERLAGTDPLTGVANSRAFEEASARALLATTRDSDIVARLGGDEFALLLPATDSDGARRMLQGLKGRVEKAAANLPSDVAFSVGAATFLVQPASVDEMIGAADEMMYAAKRAGKATFRHVTVGEESPIAVPDRGLPREPIHARS